MLTSRKACLALYPWQRWHEVEQSLVQLWHLDPNAEKMLRFVLSGATPCPIDKQGRILVPAALREYAGLEREVVVAGVGSLVELWDKGRFDQEIEETQKNYGEIASLVAALGKT